MVGADLQENDNIAVDFINCSDIASDINTTLAGIFSGEGMVVEHWKEGIAFKQKQFLVEFFLDFLRKFAILLSKMTMVIYPHIICRIEGF